MKESESLTTVSQNPPTEKRKLERKEYGKEAHPRLTYAQQIEIVTKIGCYESDQQIIDFFQKEYQRPISTAVIFYYKSQPYWQPKIEQFRKEFESKISDEPLSSKRKRIQEFSKIYNRLDAKYEHAKAMTALGYIRDEIEGKSASGNVSINQYNQYNSLGDEELRKIIDENTKFLEISEKRKKDIPVSAEEVMDGEGS